MIKLPKDESSGVQLNERKSVCINFDKQNLRHQLPVTINGNYFFMKFLSFKMEEHEEMGETGHKYGKLC